MTGQGHQIITGQVYTQNQWLPAHWDARGRHVQEQFSLAKRQAYAGQSILNLLNTQIT